MANWGDTLEPFEAADWRPRSSRLDVVQREDPEVHEVLRPLLQMAVEVLPRMQSSSTTFVHHLHAGAGQHALHATGSSVRYTLMVLLGVHRLPTSQQRRILSGRTAADWAHELLSRRAVTGLGDAGLRAWTAAEVGLDTDAWAADLRNDPERIGSTPTMEVAWVLSGLCALAARGARVHDELRLARRRLLDAFNPHTGLFASMREGRLAAPLGHVSNFADQVYPIQALARHSMLTGDAESLETADAAATSICALQGRDGQWWWHYDARTGRVVEEYPAYSVHQDAMAPMALLDLADAGGQDRSSAISRGVRWLASPSETQQPLIDTTAGVIWRKVARNDPAKAVRLLRAVQTRLHPHGRLSMIDRWFPAGHIDHETRPYHYGWLLYAWLGGMP